MSAEYSFDEAEALRHVTKDADAEQLRAAVTAVIDGADSGGYVYDEVRDLKHLLWAALTAVVEPDAPEPEAKPEPEIHAVTGTYHPVGPVRSGPVGRRAVGFQLTTKETR
jgi:hypothetical protein